MSDRIWQLKLASGKEVEWEGKTGEAAARRYVDTHRGVLGVLPLKEAILAEPSRAVRL